MDISNVILALSSLGAGGALGAFIKSRLERRDEVSRRQFELMDKRYRSLLIFMWVKATGEDPSKLARFYGRPDITTREDLRGELEIEIQFANLFASKRVMAALERFREEPTVANWQLVAKAMRKDLYGR